MVLTFEGRPHTEIGQGDSMSDQVGSQRKSQIQFAQCLSQARLTAQTPGTELQPVVDLQAPDSISN